MILKLKKKLVEKRALAQRILNDVAKSPETRDMSPEEKTQFDGVMKDIETIKTQIAQFTDLEADEASDAPEPEPEPRSAVPTPTPTPTPTPSRRGAPMGVAPAVHTAKKPYSILRAIRMRAEGMALDGLEAEVSQEIARQSGQAPKGFYMPTGSNPEIRALMYPGRRAETRADLTTGQGAGAIFTVEELPLIDYLRARMVVAKMGATMLTDMSGVFAIPRQTGTATVYWLAEGAAATPSAPAVDQVGFSPRVAIAATNISKLFLLQTSLDAEQFVKDDLANTMARELDRVAIAGNGSTEPQGLIGSTAIAANSAGLQGGPNGAKLSWSQVTGLEGQVASYNADNGKLGYLTNPRVRAVLKNTLKFPSTASAATLWDDSPAGEGVGEINGYNAMTTNLVPSNLTKGSSAGNCSSMIFGDFSSLAIAQWEGVDCVVNPYTNQLAGAVIISLEMALDVKLRHPESFAVINDVTLS